MTVRQRTPPAIFAEPESHKIKIARSPGTLVPTPPHLSRFRVGRVDQPDFFTWGQDRILRMAQRQTPSGIIIETECGTVDPQLLGLLLFTGSNALDSVQFVALPPNLNPDVAALAHQWSDGVLPGLAANRCCRRAPPSGVHSRSHGPSARRLHRSARFFPAAFPERPGLSVRLGRRCPAAQAGLPDPAGYRLLRVARTITTP